MSQRFHLERDRDAFVHICNHGCVCLCLCVDLIVLVWSECWFAYVICVYLEVLYNNEFILSSIRA